MRMLARKKDGRDKTIRGLRLPQGENYWTITEDTCMISIRKRGYLVKVHRPDSQKGENHRGKGGASIISQGG